MPNCTNHQRRGAIIPLFAITLPVLMICCAMAINLAYVQLANTEMQIAIDTAVHAGGRRLGTPPVDADGNIVLQSLSEAKEDVMDFAADIAAMNEVGGYPADIPESAMDFGRSTRGVRDNGQFTAYKFESIEDHQIPSSFRIISDDLELPHIFGPFASANGSSPSDTFTVKASSVSTQVDRDVMLVLDRSGSMIYFEDEWGLKLALDAILDETYEKDETTWEYRLQFRRKSPRGAWQNSSLGNNGFMTQAEFSSTSFNSQLEYRLEFGEKRSRENDKITQEEFDWARWGRERFPGAWNSNLYYRWYSDNLIYWLEEKESRGSNDPDDPTWTHSLGDDPETWTDGLTVEQQRAKLRGHMALYAHDFRHRYRLDDFTMSAGADLDSREAPAFSRWYHLERGVSVFLNVLGGGVDPDNTQRDGTVQKELVGMLPFNSTPDNNGTYNNPDFDYGLQDDGFPAAFVNSSSDPGYAEPYQGSDISLRDLLPTICPHSGTAIGDSLRQAAFLIRSRSDGDEDARARAFAAKTIVILTDGDNTVGNNPITIARNEIANEDMLVHTITFTNGVSASGKDAMQQVAQLAKGKYYHSDTGEELSEVFEQIANNLPTILTQ